jgi:hypothetical protein
MLRSFSYIQQTKNDYKYCLSDVILERRRVSLLLAFSRVIGENEKWKPKAKIDTLNMFLSGIVL